MRSLIAEISSFVETAGQLKFLPEKNQPAKKENQRQQVHTCNDQSSRPKNSLQTHYTPCKRSLTSFIFLMTPWKKINWFQ